MTHADAFFIIISAATAGLFALLTVVDNKDANINNNQ